MKLNKTETYNNIMQYVAQQESPAKDDTGLSRYRLGSNMCPIGSMIPDEVYSPDMEGHTLYDLLQNPEYADNLKSTLNVESDEDVEFLSVVQMIYDEAVNTEDFQSKFRDLMHTRILPSLSDE